MALAERKINVLYTHTSGYIGGGNKVLCSLFQGMNRSIYRPLSIIPESGPIEKELVRLEVPYHVIDVRPNNKAIWSKCVSALSLAAVIFKGDISLVHANDPYTYRFLSDVSFLMGKKRLCHVHHPDVTHETLAWSFKICPHFIITPSKHVGNLVRSLIGDHMKTNVVSVWNPIDTMWFSPSDNVEALRRKYSLSSSNNHISIVGTLARHKGHDVFIQMAKMIIDKIPNCEFHIIGSNLTADPEYSYSLKNMASVLGISEKVHFWGFVESEVARDLMQASDLFVLPTKEEGFGLSIAEAQACGVPVLGSAIPPLDEVVAEGVSGFLLEPDKPEQFALRATMILTSESIRRQMSGAAREWILSRFSLSSFCESITSLYSTILGLRTEGDIKSDLL